MVWRSYILSFRVIKLLISSFEVSDKFRWHTWVVCYCSIALHSTVLFSNFRAVTDPRTARRVALKKMPNVFLNIVSSKRVYRELRMLCFFKHDNVRNSPFFRDLRISFVCCRSEIVLVINQTIFKQAKQLFTSRVETALFGIRIN